MIKFNMAALVVSMAYHFCKCFYSDMTCAMSPHHDKSGVSDTIPSVRVALAPSMKIKLSTYPEALEEQCQNKLIIPFPPY